MSKNFVPTKEQIRCAEAVFVAMAHEKLIQPIVEGYEREILAKHQFRIAPCWVEQGVPDEVIRDRNKTFLMSEEDATVFFAECHAARAKANLRVENPDHCPLLVAQNVRIQAENALVESLSSIPGLESLGMGVMSLEIRDRAVELGLKLLAPFMPAADNIVARYAAKDGADKL